MHRTFETRPATFRLRTASCAVAALAVLASAVLAQQAGILQGTLKKVDPDARRVTVTSGGADEELDVVESTRFMDGSGQPLRDGLNSPALKTGAPVMFKAVKKDGRSVLFGLRLAGPGAQAKKAQLPPPKVDMSAVKPLPDMGPGEKYHGFEGGFYPGARRERPADHEAAGLALAAQVKPLDADGNPSPIGKIVLLSVGMSNTNQAFSGFMRAAGKDAEVDPHVSLVNGAMGGITAFMMDNEDGRTRPDGSVFRYWDELDATLKRAEVTRAQVQAVWVKQADAGPSQGFPAYAETLRDELVRVVQIIHKRFPNARLLYLSSRTYGGWAKTRLNPEPYAYESGFSVKWLIERQLHGDPALNFDPKKGDVRAPWLSWGPYLWANGNRPNADGFSYEEADFTPADGTHESPAGQDKIGKRLLDFFKSDPTTRSWFVGSKDSGKSGD
jgi:Cu/Ag efflux protein CusF